MDWGMRRGNMKKIMSTEIFDTVASLKEHPVAEEGKVVTRAHGLDLVKLDSSPSQQSYPSGV